MINIEEIMDSDKKDVFKEIDATTPLTHDYERKNIESKEKMISNNKMLDEQEIIEPYNTQGDTYKIRASRKWSFFKKQCDNSRKMADKKELVAAAIIISCMIAGLILIFVGIFTRIFAISMLGWSLFVGCILTAFILVKILVTMSNGKAKNDKDAEIIVAKVIICAMKSQTSSGDIMLSRERILSTLYKVQIDVDGITTYGLIKNKFYNEGDDIIIKFNKNKPKHCYIFNEKELESFRKVSDES